MIYIILAVALFAGPQAMSLIQRMLAGDRKAASTLLRTLTPVIRRRAQALLRKVFTPHQVDDLVQEVWIHLLARDGAVLRRYDGERPLEIYVGVIARRAARDVVRKQFASKRGSGKGEDELPTDDTLQSAGNRPDEIVEAGQLSTQVFKHLETTLTKRGRIIFRYLYTDGFSAEETAEALGMTLNAIHIWQHKIRKAARCYLDTQR